MRPSGFDISSPRRPENDIIKDTCPDHINVTRDILISLGAKNHFIISGYSRRLEYVVYWMKVKSWYSMQKKLSLKSEAENP